MEKLKKEDIRLLHEGEQIEKAILKKCATLEEFSKLSRISVESLYIYLHCKPYGSRQFRTKLILILDKDYNEIILNETQQIKVLIEQIKININLYTTTYDFEVISSLKELCEKFNLVEELSRIYEFFYFYYFNNNQILNAIEAIKNSIFFIKDKNEHFLLSYYIKLAGLYSLNDETEKAISINNIIEKKIKDNHNYKDDFLFEYYYKFGIIYNRKDSYVARDFFKKALSHVKNKAQIGATLTTIGFTHAKENLYEKAIEFYEKAINAYESTDKKRIASTYNNISMAYFNLGKIKEAQNNIDIAFSYLDEGDADTYFTFLGTQAKVYKSDENIFADNLINHLDNLKKTMKNKNNIIKAINEILYLINKNENIDRLIKLSVIVEELIKCNREDEYINQEHDNNLLKCYGEICYSIKVQGGV